MLVYCFNCRRNWNPTHPPPSPNLLKGGEDVPKIESLGGGTGVPNFWLESGDKPEKWG